MAQSIFINPTTLQVETENAGKILLHYNNTSALLLQQCDSEQFITLINLLFDKYYDGTPESIMVRITKELLRYGYPSMLYFEQYKDPERVRIGNRIKELREQRQWSSKELSEKSGVDATNLCRIEQGRYSVGLDVLSRIATALGMQVDLVEQKSQKGAKDPIDEYAEERTCEYKGEQYKVRDNGAVMRLPKGTRSRKDDNRWTFGEKHKDGYMYFNSQIRIHQVVATAFYGYQGKHLVVDHIDTNRCNNRPENLRWVTRLENALNNPITRKKIINICGSIEAFLESPSIIREKALPQKYEWMRTVSKEEAANCRKNLERWAKEDGVSKGGGIGEWIYKANGEEQQPQPFSASQTPNCQQQDWRIPTRFPLCPQQENNLQQYFDNLRKNDVFCSNQYGNSLVYDFVLIEDDAKLLVATRAEDIDAVKPWALCEVYVKDATYIHHSLGSFFQEDGLQKQFLLRQGKEWTGETTFDEGCS